MIGYPSSSKQLGVDPFQDASNIGVKILLPRSIDPVISGFCTENYVLKILRKRLSHRFPLIKQRMKRGYDDISWHYVALPGLKTVGQDFVTPGSSEPSVRRHLGLLTDTPPALAIGSGIEIVKIKTTGPPLLHFSLGQIFHFPRFLPCKIQPWNWPHNLTLPGTKAIVCHDI